MTFSGDYRQLSPASTSLRLAVELTVRTEGRLKDLPFAIETKQAFDGLYLLWKACFMRLSRHKQLS